MPSNFIKRRLRMTAKIAGHVERKEFKSNKKPKLHVMRWARISSADAGAINGQYSGASPHNPYALSAYAIPRA